MEKEKEIDLMKLSKTVWGKRKKLLKWALIGLVAGVVIGLSKPDEYACKIKVVNESQNKSNAMGSMSGLASMMGVDVSGTGAGGINEKIYPELVKTFPFLAGFETIEVPYKGQQITLLDYLTREQKRAWWSYVFSFPSTVMGWISGYDEHKRGTAFRPGPSELRFEGQLSSRISVAEDKGKGTYTISATMQDPVIAAIVADSLMSELNKYMIDYFTSKTRQDLKANMVMLQQAKNEYYRTDSEYAIVADRNQNLISQSAKIKIERVKNERDIAFQIYQQLASQVELVKIKLQEETPIVTIIEPARVPSGPASPNRLLIIVGFTFLFALVAAGGIVVKAIVKE